MCWREQRRTHDRCPYQWGEENLCLSSIAKWYAIPMLAPRNSPDTFLTFLGLVNPSCTGLIGSGVVVHLPSFFAELEALETQGKRFATKHDFRSKISFSGLDCKGRLFVSDRAHLVFDFHQIVDGLKEVELGGSR